MMTYNDAINNGHTFCMYCKNFIESDKKVETYDKCKVHENKKCTGLSFCEDFEGNGYWKEFYKPRCSGVRL